MLISNGDGLPEDVTLEILSWLPVKSLMRFKCVCKSWCGIVARPNFISKHLNNYYCNNTGCLLASYSVGHSQPNMVAFYPDETLMSLSNHALNLPLPCPSIYGPCNGIFFLTNARDIYALWNPGTKGFRTLPFPKTRPNLPSSVSVWSIACGFGLDPITGDYKVVVIRHLIEMDSQYSYIRQYRPSQAIVYSLSSNSWKDLEDLEQKYYFHHGSCYTYLNGFYYWWAHELAEQRKVIVSFDMSNDEFQEIQIPNYPNPDYPKIVIECLALWHESIALLIFMETVESLDIWVMVEGHWTKQFTVGPIQGIWSPFGYWKNDQVILQSTTGRLFLCDLNNREMKDLEFEGSPDSLFQDIIIYKESLVPIMDNLLV